MENQKSNSCVSLGTDLIHILNILNILNQVRDLISKISGKWQKGKEENTRFFFFSRVCVFSPKIFGVSRLGYDSVF